MTERQLQLLKGWDSRWVLVTPMVMALKGKQYILGLLQRQRGPV